MGTQEELWSSPQKWENWRLAAVKAGREEEEETQWGGWGGQENRRWVGCWAEAVGLGGRN